MKIISFFILSLVLLFASPSCTPHSGAADEHTDEQEHAEDEPGHEGEEHAEGEIHLTPEQIKTVNIAFGTFSALKINDFVRATGTLGLPPNAYFSLNAKASGFIKSSNKFVEGDYVRKGMFMAAVENPELIQRQQSYLEVSAELDYLKLELERQETLFAAAAGIEKTVQKLRSEVAMKTATTQGLAKQLAYWGIKVADLTPATIVDRIGIYAPISGYITRIDMHNGMYVSPEQELMEIVSEEHLHLELDVFEQDLAQVKEEQRISYTVPALGPTVYGGEVHVIGKEFDTENKTVRVHGHLEKERPRFLKDLFVEAKIWLNDQTVQALPSEAIIKDGAFSYIYISAGEMEGEEMVFGKLRVLPGVSDKGFTALELIDPLPEGAQIVTQGAYYVFAQSKAGELEHSH